MSRQMFEIKFSHILHMLNVKDMLVESEKNLAIYILSLYSKIGGWCVSTPGQEGKEKENKCPFNLWGQKYDINDCEINQTTQNKYL